MVSFFVKIYYICDFNSSDYDCFSRPHFLKPGQIRTELVTME